MFKVYFLLKKQNKKQCKKSKNCSTALKCKQPIICNYF